MFTHFIKNTLMGISTLVFVAGLISVPTVKAATGDIVDVASNASQFSTLVTAVKAADLVSTLQGPGPFTVLAPTNEAFAKVPADVLAKLLLPENKASLVKVLTYHVIAGKVDASQVVKLTTTKTVETSSIKIAVVDGKVKLNDTTTVTATDISATNGIIHQIDSVLLPANLDLTKLTDSKMMTVRSGGSSINYITVASLAFLALSLIVATRQLRLASKM